MHFVHVPVVSGVDSFIFDVVLVSQDDNCEARPMVISEQMSNVAITAQQTFPNFSRHAVSSQKPIDLSCHEMDVSVERGSTSVEHQSVDEEMADSQGT